MDDSVLASIWRRANADQARLSVSEIRVLAQVDAAGARLHALLQMRRLIDAGDVAWLFFEIARPLVSDPHNTCRWQALIVLGAYLQEHPDAVWEVIVEHGSSEDEDLRDGVATVLLEHLLEIHPQYRTRVEAQARHDPLFAAMLRTCW